MCVCVCLWEGQSVEHVGLIESQFMIMKVMLKEDKCFVWDKGPQIFWVLV